MKNLDSTTNSINLTTESKINKIIDETAIKAIKIRDNNEVSKRIKFDSDINKKLMLMMTYWEIDHSEIVTKAIHELYANKFLIELNELKN